MTSRFHPIMICLGVLVLLSSCTQRPAFMGFTYPEGHFKALVLSYDDGTIQDVALAKLFDDNGLVGTFNLNSGYLGVTRAWPQENGDTVFQKYLSKEVLLSVFKDHEIAVHGALHKDFAAISSEEVLEEVATDLNVLTELTGRKMRSMAYPFGNTSDKIAGIVAGTGLINGRTIDDTHAFTLPEDFMMWHPTCHDSRALDFVEAYMNKQDHELSLFYVWGHSWEFGDEKRLANMERFCETIGTSKDIWFVGNGIIAQYLNAIKNVRIEENALVNPSDNLEVWVQLSSGNRQLKPGEVIRLKQ